MSKSNAYETALLQLIFNNTDFTNIADAVGVTNLYVALHTADPGEAGNQETSELAYDDYARVAVERKAGTGPATGGWDVSVDEVTPNENIQFPEMALGAGGTASFFSIGTLITGAGLILYSGTVSPNIVVSNGVTPILTTATKVTED